VGAMLYFLKFVLSFLYFLELVGNLEFIVGKQGKESGFIMKN
jgi:hypothetical protein